MEIRNLRHTWEAYVDSWKTTSVSERWQLFSRALDKNSVYIAPAAQIAGYRELAQFMDQFHKSFPGYYFETTYFQAHHASSIARWHLKNAEGKISGEGMSYAIYNEKGLLTLENGFYETAKWV